MGEKYQFHNPSDAELSDEEFSKKYSSGDLSYDEKTGTYSYTGEEASVSSDEYYSHHGGNDFDSIASDYEQADFLSSEAEEENRKAIGARLARINHLVNETSKNPPVHARPETDSESQPDYNPYEDPDDPDVIDRG